MINEIHGGREEGSAFPLTGQAPQSQGDMCLSGTGRSHEDNVLFLMDETEVAEIEDL